MRELAAWRLSPGAHTQRTRHPRRGWWSPNKPSGQRESEAARNAAGEPISWSAEREHIIRDEQIKRANDLIEQSRGLALEAITALASGDQGEFRRKWHQHEFVDHELADVIAILMDEERDS